MWVRFPLPVFADCSSEAEQTLDKRKVVVSRSTSPTLTGRCPELAKGPLDKRC